jgi:REP element-mobilizing transposase RayT
MSREPRAFEPGRLYHLISRVVANEFLITSASQRSHYLELQWRALQYVDWKLLGFALMSNHIHLMAMAGDAPLDAWLRPAHSRFADIVNKDRNRIGPVLVRGPTAYPVDSGRAAHLLAYIHNNPVRANVVGSAVESNWTSHRAYVGAADVPLCLDVGLGRTLTGMGSDQLAAWVDDPAQRADRSFSEEAHEREMQRVREYASETIPRELHQSVAVAIVESAAMHVGITSDAIRNGNRRRPAVQARAVAVRCGAALGLTETVVAHALQISQQRVSMLRQQAPSNDIEALAVLVQREIRSEIASKL